MIDKPRSGTESIPLDRRSDLVQATLECIAEAGLRSTTVRNVAIRAGVTNGLIRHYFSTKDQLIQEAYRTMIHEMHQPAKDAASEANGSPEKHLSNFIVASLTPPVLDIKRLCMWASFISLIHVDTAIAKIHREGYLEFREILVPIFEDLFTQRGTPIDRETASQYAIKVNSIIDGLWLEGCLDPDSFKFDGLSDIGIEAVEAVLGVSLIKPETKR